MTERETDTEKATIAITKASAMRMLIYPNGGMEGAENALNNIKLDKYWSKYITIKIYVLNLPLPVWCWKYKHRNIHCNTKYNNDLSFQDYSPHPSINLNYMYFQKGRNFNNKISEWPEAFESITKCVMGVASQIAVVNSTLFRWNFVKDLFIILFSHLQIWRHLNDSSEDYLFFLIQVCFNHDII